MRRTRGIFRGNCLAAKWRLCGRMPECNDEDELFYRRVCDNISGGNPLASVLDREYMGTLSQIERERYVFNLSAKVQRCIDRFSVERLDA